MNSVKLSSEYSTTGDANNFKWESIPDINYSVCKTIQETFGLY